VCKLYYIYTVLRLENAGWISLLSTSHDRRDTSLAALWTLSETNCCLAELMANCSKLTVHGTQNWLCLCAWYIRRCRIGCRRSNCSVHGQSRHLSVSAVYHEWVNHVSLAVARNGFDAQCAGPYVRAEYNATVELLSRSCILTPLIFTDANVSVAKLMTLRWSVKAATHTDELVGN